MKLKVGMRVRLTGQFLRSTGQVAGGEGQKVWTIQACECRNCRDGFTVAVDEPKADLSYWTDEELAAEPYLRVRHINPYNLSQVGKPSLRDVC